MRHANFKRSTHLSNAPVDTFDTDVGFECIIRDSMAVLLGHLSLRLLRENANTDPYNRAGPLARTRLKALLMLRFAFRTRVDLGYYHLD